MPIELIALLNLLLTFCLAVGLTFAVQYFLILLWGHRLNRRYYKHKRLVTAATEAKDARALHKLAKGDTGPERAYCCGLLGPKRTKNKVTTQGLQMEGRDCLCLAFTPTPRTLVT